MTINNAELTALHRSTAMVQPRSPAPVRREVFMEIVEELLEQRRLLARLGGDLKTVARHGTRSDADPPRRTAGP